MSKSIAEIKAEINNCPVEQLGGLLTEYTSDERSGVIKLVESGYRKIHLYEAELERTELMKQFEYKYSDYKFICGIDEVGRGPLAGPVVAGAVILPKECDILYLNDSKQLSAKKREELYEQIKEKAVAAKTAIVSPAVIDDINILQATYKAMRMAVSSLDVKPDLLLNDAVNIPEVDIKQVGIIKGDSKSISIAAASIIAKVERDAMMVEYDKMYPEYDFAGNKGYGAPKHLEALRTIGPCPIHRKTFIQGILNGE